MKGKLRSLVVGAATAVTAAGLSVMAGGGVALAAGGGGPTPPWESQVTASLNGSIQFYNAQGQVITGGSLSSGGLGAFAVASSAASSTSFTKATLYMFTPVSGQNPGTWASSQLSLSTNFPNAAAPMPIGTTANPVVSGPDGSLTLAQAIAANPNTQTAAGFVGLYDLRLKVSGTGVPQQTTYWDAVISVDTSTNTWSLDFPDFTQNTTTTLGASPPSPQTAPASPVTLTATVAPATAGTVAFFSGSTQIGTTQTVTATNGVATVSTTPPSGSTPYQAFFTPVVGSADIGSSSNMLNYQVNAPLDATSTSLAQTGGGGPAGLVTFTGTVTDTTTPATIITTGTVSLFDNGSSTPFASGAVGAGGAFSIPFTYSSAGAHSVVATFVPATGSSFAGSSSAPVTFTEQAPACTTCTDVQTITATVPAGTISISTPYTATNPLNLGTLQLNPAGTFFSATAQLDPNAADVPTAGQSPNPTFNGITVVDTQSGSLPWTVSAASSNLTSSAPGTISGENVGLTGLTGVFVPGNAIVAGDVTFTNQAAASPPVGPTDTGSLGLGGGIAHAIAADSAQPAGTVGINGTVTLNAPTSTPAGIYTGTITFTIVG